MENDTSTMTPVQASNQSAALPGVAGGSGPAPAGVTGGASAAYGGASTAAAPAPVTQPYSTMTTPTAVNVPNPRARPFAGPNPRLRQDVVTSPAFGARGASEIQWTAQSELSQDQEEAIRTEAGRLGIAPSILASVMAYETIGTFDTDIKGGTGGNYRGLIQFGPEERRTYGYRDGMTFQEQLAGPVHAYLVDRGLKPGMGVAEVYSIINAGSLKNGQPRWGASDRPGWNVRRHAEEITRTRLPGFTYLDEGWSPPARPEVDIPNPPPRPDRGGSGADPAFGAEGARSMPDMVPGSPSAAYGPLATVAAEPAPAMPGVARVVNIDGDLLVRGSKGDPAREWQAFLNDNGYTDARGRPLSIDGDFGLRTKEATKAFQRASQIEADGIVGPETLSAALFVADPTSSPMPGQVAYTDGANAAQKIIDPAAPEVAIALPRPRPERGAGIPNPPANPRRDGLPADGLTADQIDQMTMVDENGNYLNPPAPQPPREARTKDDAVTTSPAVPDARPAPSMPLRTDANGDWYFGPADVGQAASEYRSQLLEAGAKDGPGLDAMIADYEQMLKAGGRFRYASGWTAAEIGRETSNMRDQLLASGVKEGPGLDAMVNRYESTLKRIIAPAQRQGQAISAARGATRQRLAGTEPTSDRFRPRDRRRGGEAERVRVAEAVREFARGTLDTYLRVRDRSRTAPAVALDPDQQPLITDAVMRAAATPAETVTETYAFRRRA